MATVSTGDKPVHDRHEYTGIDPSEMAIFLDEFESGHVSADDPNEPLVYEVVRRLEKFNEALAAYIGRLAQAGDTEKLEALAEAVRQTGDYLAADTASNTENAVEDYREMKASEERERLATQ